MDAKELLERYSEGERNFENVNLSRIEIQGKDLTGINLEGANLSNSSLSRVIFNDANLKRCNFNQSRLNQVEFHDSDLTNVNFRRTSLSAVIFKTANLTETNFFNVTGISSCKFIQSVIINAKFYKVDMRSINFSNLRLEGCDFSGANISNGNFTSSNLQDARFIVADLTSAILTKSDIKGGIFIAADLTNSRTYGWVNAERADFTDAIMPDGEPYQGGSGSPIASRKKSQSEPQFIDTENAPKSPNSPHQAVIVNGSLHVAGQIAIDPRVNAMLCEDEITEQTRRVMENLTAILTAAGAGWSDVVKTTIYMVDLEECDRMNSVYSQYFPDGNLPICTCVAVSQLPQNVRVQIECVATV